MSTVVVQTRERLVHYSVIVKPGITLPPGRYINGWALDPKMHGPDTIYVTVACTPKEMKQWRASL